MDKREHLGDKRDLVPSPLAEGLAAASSFVLCIVLPVLMVVANKSAPASLGLAALLANVAFLAAHPPAALLARYLALLRTGTARCLMLLALLGIASLAWTIDRAMTHRGLVEALPELVFVWCLAAAWPAVRRAADPGLLRYGILAAALLIGFEALSGMPLHHLFGARAESFDLKRSAVPLVLLLWPALDSLPVTRRRTWAAALVGAAFAAALFAHSSASVLAVGLAVALFVAARLAPRSTLYGCGALAFVLVAVTPWTGTIVQRALSSRAMLLLQEQHASHRVRIWTAFEHHIRDKHLLGHGFDTSFRVADLVEQEGGGAPATDNHVIDNIHPHDVLLQVWVEFGLLGAVALGVAIVFVVARIRRLDRAAQAFRLAFLGAAAMVALVGLNAWAPWWLAVAATALTVFAALREGVSTAPRIVLPTG